MDTPDLIGTAEAARLIERSPRTIHRLVRAKQLTPVHTAPGGHHGAWLFSRADVEAIKAERNKSAA